MSEKIVIKLDRFIARKYQLPLMDAIENKGYKRVLGILPRRAGKDMMALNIAIRQCITKICIVYYIFPTYAQAKKAIWNNITIEGMRMLDYIPKELIASMNSQEMIIKFKNGSVIQFVGSDNYDSLRGTNPYAIIFSEYSYQDPRAYVALRPILAANNGWALFISTPFGKNHLYDLFKIAQNSTDWFCYKLTLEDTNHIPFSEIEKERSEGLMSEDMIQQEYYTSFDMGVEGAIYSKYINSIRIKGQIADVPWEPNHKVHTAWDIGVGAAGGDDKTAIVFFQCVGQIVRVIDYYEGAGVGLDHYIKVINTKPYIYGIHLAPHDMKQRVWTEGAITRIEKARQLGINFTLCDNPAQPPISLMDGIETVRATFPKLWIDERNCVTLLKCLESYRRQWDADKGRYSDKPLHNWASDGADAVRYMCIGLHKTKPGTTPEDLERRYNEALYGSHGNFPSVFREPR